MFCSVVGRKRSARRELGLHGYNIILSILSIYVTKVVQVWDKTMSSLIMGRFLMDHIPPSIASSLLF